MLRKLSTALLALALIFSTTIGATLSVNAGANTLYEYYGHKLPSLSERAITAAQVGIFGYRGTAEQNIKLLEILNSQQSDIGFSVVSNYKTTLSASMTSSQATIPVSSLATKDGHTLAFSDLGSSAYFVVEPGGSKEEIIKCTAIVSTSWSSCTRGLAFYGTATTSVLANQKAHNAGSIVVMSNVHYVYEELADKDSSETLAGVKTFSSSPIVPTPTSSDSTYAANVAYVNATAFAGAPNASTTVKGISEEATTAEINANTAAGSTGAELFINPALLGASNYANFLPSTGQKDALAGTSGTPGTSNKYVTNDDTDTAATASKIARRSASGQITVPATPVASTDASSKGYVDLTSGEKIAIAYTDVTLTNTVTETTLVTAVIPANTLSTNNGIYVRLNISSLANTGGQNITFKFKYGATTLITSSGIAPVNTQKGYIDFYLFATGATNSQEGFYRIYANDTATTANNALYTINAADTGTSAIDSTASQNLVVTGQWTLASLSDTITISNAIVEKIR